MTYATATAFRQALEDRLRRLSLESNTSLIRLRKLVAIDRLLARMGLAGLLAPAVLRRPHRRFYNGLDACRHDFPEYAPKHDTTQSKAVRGAKRPSSNPDRVARHPGLVPSVPIVIGVSAATHGHPTARWPITRELRINVVVRGAGVAVRGSGAGWGRGCGCSRWCVWVLG